MSFAAHRSAISQLCRAFSTTRIVAKAPALADVPGAVKLSRACGVKVTKTLLEAGLPIPPIGPASGYGLFYRDFLVKNQDRVDSLSGAGSITTMTQAAGDAWRATPESQREEYLAEGRRRQAQYAKDFAEYEKTVTKAQIRQTEKILRRKLRHPGGRSLSDKGRYNQLGAPPRPTSAFILYLQDVRDAGEYPGLSNPQVATEAGKVWRAKSDEEKKPWVDRSVEVRKAFKAWKEEHADDL